MSDAHEFATDNKRSGTALVAVLAVLLVALLAAWFLVLKSGTRDAEPAPFPEVESAPAPVGDGGGTGQSVVRPGTGPVETFQVFASRDPFAPLIGPEGEDSGGSSGGTSGGSSSGGSGGASVGGHRVTMVDVFESKGSPRAQVQVDDSVYTVEEGETFADNFELLSISGSCGTLLFGDDQFTLCEGEQILK